LTKKQGHKTQETNKLKIKKLKFQTKTEGFSI